MQQRGDGQRIEAGEGADADVGIERGALRIPLLQRGLHAVARGGHFGAARQLVEAMRGHAVVDLRQRRRLQRREGVLADQRAIDLHTEKRRNRCCFSLRWRCGWDSIFAGGTGRAFYRRGLRPEAGLWLSFLSVFLSVLSALHFLQRPPSFLLPPEACP